MAHNTQDVVRIPLYLRILLCSVERLGGQLVTVDDLVKQSDYIILTVVLVPETRFIINKDRLNLMKPNAVIINVGRGRKQIFIVPNKQTFI